MKNLIIAFLFMCVGLADNAFAAHAGNSGGSGVLVWFFIGFIALFIVSQLIPSVILLFSIFKGLFSKADVAEHEHSK